MSKMPLIKFARWTLDGNYHGANQEPLRWTASIVQMGAHCQSWTLYLYAGSGACIGLNVAFPRWRREWRP